MERQNAKEKTENKNRNVPEHNKNYIAEHKKENEAENMKPRYSSGRTRCKGVN